MRVTGEALTDEQIESLLDGSYARGLLVATALNTDDDDAMAARERCAHLLSARHADDAPTVERYPDPVAPDDVETLPWGDPDVMDDPDHPPR